ncbi:MFS transporter [Prauserella muralis]|uniref:Nitrate/nitrite transporter n=1 Tax=Prauserella muralis TaxID=588067 RepID=A0A2V4AI42_9PSEU|nr:MFS transporter [Prauserella muralis]PXY19588.1 nitrate/nitrite transporter [Prauserella muralis]TWE29584.1 MFS transporter [Prauserella muralis]
MPKAVPVREIRDFYGRRYRVGETDRDLLKGRSRAWMLWAAWTAMLVASVGQYGFGALMPVLGETHDWSLAESGWVLAVWILCQSGTVYPAARLRTRLGLPPAATMLAGAVLCAAGLVTLGGSSGFAVVLLNHGVLGGIGAGLIYGTCLGVVATWYPERPGRTAFVSGAFAYGSIPFVLLAGQFAGPGGTGVFLGIAGAAVVVVVGAAAAILRDPPRHWWPAHVDPRAWALDKSVNPALRRNRPPIRHYSTAEMVRVPASGLLYLAVTCLAAVILFDIAYLAVFATASGWSTGFGAVALAVLAAGSGATRTAEGWASERFGRRRVVRLALVAGGVAQVVLLVAGEQGLAGLLLAGAALAGAAAGACYGLLPGLVEGHFGERPGLPNFGIFYGAKSVGGLLGVALAGYAVGSDGYAVGFLVAAVLSFTGAGLVRYLRQPGLPRLSLPGLAAEPGSRVVNA